MAAQRRCLSLAALALCICGLAVAAAAQNSQKQVTSLPGWSGPLPSNIWSGYTDVGKAPDPNMGEMLVHWVFIESERSPATDPVVVWYQGGPGASGLFGLFVEFGPFMLNDESLNNAAFNATGVPQLVRNNYAWTKVSNLLIVDNPPPVGFSYCTKFGPSGNGTSCGPWNDTTVAVSQRTFLANWIKQMSKFASNDMYITGESYAGVYVPTIVREVLKNPSGINLKGFAVGDGCMGTQVLCGGGAGPYWDIEFFHGHGQVSNRLYNNISATCDVAALKSGKNISPACNALISQMWNSIGGYYAYNLYDECYVHNLGEPRSWWSGHPRLGAAENDYPCPGNALAMWINRTDVRLALGVDPNSYYFSGDNGVGFNYSLTEPDLLPFYAQVITEGKLRVLVYNGDTDPGINSFITQDKYTEYFDQQKIPLTQEWRPWTLDGQAQMGGYVLKYANNFHYLTIRGSGHMVPEFKPPAALVFLQNFLAGTEYPSYNPPPSPPSRR